MYIQKTLKNTVMKRFRTILPALLVSSLFLLMSSAGCKTVDVKPRLIQPERSPSLRPVTFTDSSGPGITGQTCRPIPEVWHS